MRKSSFFHLTGKVLLLAGLCHSPVFAQHEVDTEADHGPIKISSNENPFGYSQMAMMAMMQAMPQANRYPWEEQKALVDAIAAKELVPPEFLMVTPGSGAILQMAALAYAAEGKNMITVTPGYMQLTRLFEQMGGTIKAVPVDEETLGYDMDAIKAAIDEDTVLVYLCNPNNPTGTVIDPDELRAFLNDLPDGVLAFIDEAYLELAPGGLEKYSMIDAVRTSSKDIILVRTFSKVYGMAGLRLGFGVARPEILEKLKPYNYGGVSVLSLVAGAAALQDADFFNMSVSSYTAVRAMVKAELDSMGIKYAEPNGSFIFMQTGMPVSTFQKAMEAENILVGRPFPPLLDWARVSIGTEEEMNIFLAALHKILNK